MFSSLRRFRNVPVLSSIVLLSLCSSSLTLAAPVATFEIHNFMPEFWTFWTAAQNQTVERQAELWRDLYVMPHQEVFNDLAGPCKDQFDPEWARTHYFPSLAKIAPGMRELTDALPQKLEAAQDRFLRLFPDMRWTGDIYVMASGYCFNGRAQSIRGHGAILFGIDAVVGLGQKDLIPGMTHELFHRYHQQFFDFTPSSGDPLWTVLWAEGLAQYVAEQLNPMASEVDLSHVPIGMVQQVDDKRRELAADFLKRFTATDEADAKRWFNDINSKDPVVPARAGYELGVLVVRELSKHYTLQAMAHWSRAQTGPRVREALISIAQARERSHRRSGTIGYAKRSGMGFSL